ncbi:hypothetical protein [Moheibacter lacus]|uniref:LTXXQ motif family protein n=1 Tax=Moheibacter lacus TaxID=2745851 RepID=A0A838ZLZ5_9FLAO|nr:hypothetical protein [Moheibacter lacus]MBA5628586.1 hypothetical protein [Moheibacter lacus]
MKKSITLTALTLVIAVSAQEKTEKEDRPKPPRDKMEMFENLNLTEKQKVEIQTMFEENKEDRQAMRNEKGNSLKSETGKRALTDEEKKEFKAKKDAHRQEMDAKLKTILTADQYKQFTIEREKRHEEMEKRKKISRDKK